MATAPFKSSCNRDKSFVSPNRAPNLFTISCKPYGTVIQTASETHERHGHAHAGCLRDAVWPAPQLSVSAIAAQKPLDQSSR